MASARAERSHGDGTQAARICQDYWCDFVVLHGCHPVSKVMLHQNDARNQTGRNLPVALAESSLRLLHFLAVSHDRPDDQQVDDDDDACPDR